MIRTKLSLTRLVAIISSSIFFLSCNNVSNIPFPQKELGYSQPVSMPLVFSAAKPLKWDTVNKQGVVPEVKKFDIESLPSFPFDSTGFKSFSKDPSEVPFDFNTLPAKDLSLTNLPSHPLIMTTQALGLVPTIKAGAPLLQKGKPLSIYDFAKAQGMQAKLITSLFTSSDGALWIGCSEGLFRYDGDQIQIYLKGSPSDPPIIGLTEDTERKIWFMKDDYIGMIDQKKGAISTSKKIGYKLNGLSKMVNDEAGNIWVYNLTARAVSIINPKTMTFKNIPVKDYISDSTGFQQSNLPRDLQILQDNAKNIWITTMGGGVNIIEPSTNKIKYFAKINGLGNDTVTSVTKDKNGVVWLGMPAGVDAIDLKRKTITHYSESQGLSHSYSIWLFFDREGKLWRGTFNGIEIINFKNKETRKITEANGLSSNVVTSIIADKNDHIWVATQTGLNRIDQDGLTAHAFGAANIISLKEDGERNLWVATQQGLFIVNPQRNKMHLLDKSHGLSDNFVQSFSNQNGNMIVATDGGYNIIDPANNTLSVFSKKQGLINDSIYVAYPDKSGAMWLSGPTKGIFLLDSENKLMVHTDASGGLSDDVIMDVNEDNNALIWLATNNNGVDVIDIKTGKVKYLNNQPGLQNKCNRMLLQDKYGRMWIGTDHGIYVADIKNNTITNISLKEGLADNTVLSLLEYNGMVVAGTKNKVNIIQAPVPGDSRSAWKIEMLKNSSGLIRENNSWSSDAVTHVGKFLWGDAGISIINEIRGYEDSAQTSITGFTVMGQPQYYISEYNDSIYKSGSKSTWDSVSGPYNLPVNLSLPYDKNYLQFQFAQTSLDRPDTILYTYILEGIDKDWSLPGTNTFSQNYLNLPAGNYNFKVSSKGVNSQWSKPAEFKFTITPPWYQRWWAYALFTLIALGLLRLYIVYRSRKLKQIVLCFNIANVLVRRST